MPHRTNIRELEATASRLYSDQFLTNLGKRFRFNALELEIAYEFRRMARRYLIAKDEEPWRGRKSYYEKELLALSRKTEKFIEVLKEAQDADDIATRMFMLARAVSPTNDPFGILDLPESQIGGRNDRHYLRLLALTELLSATVRRDLNQFKLPRGPRKNEALETLVLMASYLWSHFLNRKFSIDYHQGVALTEAFEFVSAL